MEISGSTPHDDGPSPQPDLEPAAIAREPVPVRFGAAQLAGYLAIYTILRIALVAALAAILAIFMPLIVALLFAIIVQLPLSWLLFATPRRRVNEAIAQVAARRRAERARLQSALSGDEPPS